MSKPAHHVKVGQPVTICPGTGPIYSRSDRHRGAGDWRVKTDNFQGTSTAADGAVRRDRKLQSQLPRVLYGAKRPAEQLEVREIL